MRSWTLFAAFAGLVAVAVADFISSEQGDGRAKARPDASSERSSLRVMKDEPPAAAATAATAATSRVTAVGGQRRDPLCNAGSDCIDDPLSASSEAELRWMRQHSYPTKAEAERLAGLSEAGLEAEARRGVLTAMTELGSRQLDRGDSNGLNWLREAKNRGSLYAYYGRSRAELSRPSGHGFVEAGAFLRVAYMLGDRKAATALHQLVEEHRLGMIELDAIDRRASSLHQTYAGGRAPVPRPW
jgi:hypothetical protein